MRDDLKSPITVPFDKLFLDPNNPRIAADDRPGYESPDQIFDAEIQEKLYARAQEVYDVNQLEQAIVTQGWVPLDAILVWEHHKKKKHYIVVEGNTRTAVLRRLRARLPKEATKLERMKAKAKKYAKQELEAQEKLVARITEIIADTEQILVYPVNAKNPKELEEKLPRLLGVRHVTHAQQWSPYATNLYMLTLYERMFEERHGNGETLKLEPDLVDRVGDMVSTGSTKTRRNIQAARAFSHFRSRYEDELEEGDSFSDADQYYFEMILQNKFAQTQFDFGKEDLHLSEEAERVLFQWAFAHPRESADESKNILRKAEDIRLWARIKRYDENNGTSFHARLDVENPENAESMAKVEAAFLTHKNQISPLVTLQSLLDSFGDLKAETLMSQASHLKPLLEQAKNQAESYLTMISSVADGE